MTQPESPVPHSGSDSAAPAGKATDEGSATPAPPEPLTPQRVREWNAYYDLYVVLGVVILCFVASANRITHSTIWSQLKAGQVMASKGGPLRVDEFSYATEGSRWVNIPWLFDLSHALLHDAAARLVPADPNDPISPTRRSEQVGAAALIGLAALVRVATLVVLLGIRYPGPGLWWAAICATLAIGAVYSPLGVVLGGIGGPASVSPETWGQLFLAIELLLLHRATALGRHKAAFGLIPLFLLWANVSESFLIGLLVLAAFVIGRYFGRASTSGETNALPGPRALLLLGLCALVSMVNPSGPLVYSTAFGPFLQLFQPTPRVITSEQISYFGSAFRSQSPSPANSVWFWLIAYFLTVVGTGFYSFILNRRRFSLARFLVYLVAVFVWACYVRFGVYFAIVFAMVLTLNGQEWYHSRFGVEGKLGRGWAAWSTGGRFVTILLVFLMVSKCLTGYGRVPGDSVFGFGYNADDFPFESAEMLKTSKIQGRVLNTTRLQGDAIIWKAYPSRKSFVDGRHHLFSRKLQDQLHEIRLALADDKMDVWKPLLDRDQVSAVMIEPRSAPKTYRTLMKSSNWIPFYDDGNVMMFGRADASKEDVELFKSTRLDAEQLAYHSTKPVPPIERPPTPVGRLDQVFQGRFARFPQPHTEVAQRWIQGLEDSQPDAPPFPDPARCLLAIREARTALSRQPDDSQAYRILSEVYRVLMMQESALLAGIELTPENREKVENAPFQPQLLMNRFRQRVTALNFAIQSSPPPRNEAESQSLFRLNLELFQLFMAANYRDLARDRLQAALLHSTTETSTFRNQLRQEFGMLDDTVRQTHEALTDAFAQQQTNPIGRAQEAIAQSLPGVAIQELEEAIQINVTVNAVKPYLIDLYCDTGQPEKALDLISTSNVDDPSLGTEPGLAAFRQGRVHMLLGNYTYASTLWKTHSIEQIRMDRSYSALSSGLFLLQGEGKPASQLITSLPSKLVNQTNWLYELGLCQLESGQTDLAGESLEQALTLNPNLPTRPIIAYYLEKLGKKVPPAPEVKDEDRFAPKMPKVELPDFSEVNDQKPSPDADDAASPDAGKSKDKEETTVEPSKEKEPAKDETTSPK